MLYLCCKLNWKKEQFRGQFFDSGAARGNQEKQLPNHGLQRIRGQARILFLENEYEPNLCLKTERAPQASC